MQEVQKLQEQLRQQGTQVQQQHEQQRAVLAAHDHTCEELRDQLAAAEQARPGFRLQAPLGTRL